MNKYWMTLRPLDAFFFGQENKYRKRQEGNIRNNLKTVADYYQESAYFPQQTTVLGTLRYYLLMINGQLPINNYGEAQKLIGKKSFRVTDKPLQFGQIKSLSPLFLRFNDKLYCPQPLDRHVSGDQLKEYEQTTKKVLRTNVPNTNKEQIFFSDYKEKTGLSHLLMDMANPSQYIPYSFDASSLAKGAYVPEERIGIQKGEGGQTEEAAFYKQVAYRLRDGGAFACLVELDSNKISDGHVGTVPMGAEKSLFKIQFEATDQNLDELVGLSGHGQHKLVLLSDAYLPNDFQQHFHFSISNSQPFRFLETNTEAGYRYDKLHFDGNQNKETVRSIRYNLFQRGSVFYFNTATELDLMKGQLKGQFNFRTIGYNHFVCPT